MRAPSFTAMDADGNGSIDFDEFVALMREREPNATLSQLHSRFAELDQNGDACIDRHEYLLYALLEGLVTNRSTLIEQFEKWDTDASGKLERREFRRLVRALDMADAKKCSDKDIDLVFDLLDVDGSCAVTFHEILSAHRLGHAKSRIRGLPTKKVGAALSTSATLQVSNDDSNASSTFACSALTALRALMDKEMQRLTALFREWDTDGSGLVSRREFHRGLAALSCNASKQQIDALFDSIDMNKSGSIDYAELRQAFAKSRREANSRPSSPAQQSPSSTPANQALPRPMDLAEAFALMDKNGDGILSREDVVQTCQRHGRLRSLLGFPSHIKPADATQRSFERAFHLMDKGGSHTVDFSEFCAFFGRWRPHVEDEGASDRVDRAAKLSGSKSPQPRNIDARAAAGDVDEPLDKPLKPRNLDRHAAPAGERSDKTLHPRNLDGYAAAGGKDERSSPLRSASASCGAPDQHPIFACNSPLRNDHVRNVDRAAKLSGSKSPQPRNIDARAAAGDVDEPLDKPLKPRNLDRHAAPAGERSDKTLHPRNLDGYAAAGGKDERSSPLRSASASCGAPDQHPIFACNSPLRNDYVHHTNGAVSAAAKAAAAATAAAAAAARTAETVEGARTKWNSIVREDDTLSQLESKRLRWSCGTDASSQIERDLALAHGSRRARERLRVTPHSDSHIQHQASIPGPMSLPQCSAACAASVAASVAVQSQANHLARSVPLVNDSSASGVLSSLLGMRSKEIEHRERDRCAHESRQLLAGYQQQVSLLQAKLVRDLQQLNDAAARNTSSEVQAFMQLGLPAIQSLLSDGR